MAKALYQKPGKTDYDDPLLYHLVLNMSKISLEEAKKNGMQPGVVWQLI